MSEEVRYIDRLRGIFHEVTKRAASIKRLSVGRYAKKNEENINALIEEMNTYLASMSPTYDDMEVYDLLRRQWRASKGAFLRLVTKSRKEDMSWMMLFTDAAHIARYLDVMSTCYFKFDKENNCYTVSRKIFRPREERQEEEVREDVPESDPPTV